MRQSRSKHARMGQSYSEGTRLGVEHDRQVVRVNSDDLVRVGHDKENARQAAELVRLPAAEEAFLLLTLPQQLRKARGVRRPLLGGRARRGVHVLVRPGGSLLAQFYLVAEKAVHCGRRDAACHHILRNTQQLGRDVAHSVVRVRLRDARRERVVVHSVLRVVDPAVRRLLQREAPLAGALRSAVLVADEGAARPVR